MYRSIVQICMYRCTLRVAENKVLLRNTLAQVPDAKKEVASRLPASRVREIDQGEFAAAFTLPQFTLSLFFLSSLAFTRRVLGFRT